MSNFRVVLVKNCDRFGLVCDRTSKIKQRRVRGLNPLIPTMVET
ncbi:hypothetical protein [Nostoc sp. ATCC 53789]|nr:hypothetical protein [Nostoc sp. ATCC 53789]